jgi:hypothetical protein
VANGDAETDVKLPFQFIGAPVLRLASPLKGPVTGGTRIAISGNNFRYPQTKITVGGAPLLDAEYKSSIRIEGVVPPAAGGALGPVSIVATDDPIGATSTLQTPFVYEKAASDAPDAGTQADPVGAP